MAAFAVVGKGVGRVALVEREALWDSSFGAALVLGCSLPAKRLSGQHRTLSRVSFPPMVRSLSRPVRF